MSRFTWNYYGNILRIAIVQNIKRKKPKSHDKQNLVIKIQMKEKGTNNTIWNMITRMYCSIEKQGRKTLDIFRTLNEMMSKNGHFTIRKTDYWVYVFGSVSAVF